MILRRKQRQPVKDTSKMGRPRVKKYQTYQRVAIRPQTYAVFKKQATKKKMKLVDWFDEIAEEIKVKK